MKTSALEFIRDHIFIILGVLCVLVVGVIYIVSRTPQGRLVDPADVIYDAAADPQVLAQQYEPAPAVSTAEAPPMRVEPEAPQAPEIIVVHIVGEVENPGVFELETGARVYDALQLAGGATEDADLTRINLAAFLQDAMQIIVPAVGDNVDEVFIFAEGSAPGASPGPPPQTGGLVNINTATLEQLQTLPGVGPVMAENIIAYRESVGGFASVDDLINVTRIGEATLERLRPLVTV
ncbi:MAG: helix-hairpin-helix domain-containing protein [Defluviitaleaceae bacterium]|nr:helix-hairpin-helix domain-containing protein [Defluviitaleaceae bacterium]